VTADIDWLALAHQQAERFWSKVARGRPDECWLWEAGRCTDGYGKFAITAPPKHAPKQKHVRAHRLSYELQFGAVPAALVIRHKCDNPLCVNPSHLTTGTQAENIRDAIERGRFFTPRVIPRRRGSAHPHAVINEAVVVQIRALKDQGMGPAEIARVLGVSANIAGSVGGRKTWRHV
jgi:hypothetical protein